MGELGGEMAMLPAASAGRGRWLAEEEAVALCYNGTTQAVMMATPADLEDFGRGFTLTEGIAAPDQIDEISVQRHPHGIEVQMWLAPQAATRLEERRRSRAGPVGCGLCGLDSLAEAMRPPPQVRAGGRLDAGALARAVADLRRHQPLHDVVRAVHAAAFWRPGTGGITHAREDVGRHNALDKLAGALARDGVAAAGGAVLMTSRLSVDLVQKCCRLGAPVLVAVSAPTRAAVRMAQDAGLTLIGLAGGGGLEIFAHPQRIGGLRPGKDHDVA